MADQPDEATLAQVGRQCRAVSHMAQTIANIHTDYAKMYEGGEKGMAPIAEIVGERTSQLLEELGDILNGMDAVTDDDEWVNPIIAEAQKRWPAK